MQPTEITQDELDKNYQIYSESVDKVDDVIAKMDHIIADLEKRDLVPHIRRNLSGMTVLLDRMAGELETCIG